MRLNKFKIRIEDIIFLILIIATLVVILWKLFGSPTDLATLITIGTFLISSELLIWKKIFAIENNFDSKLLKMDKNISIGFMQIKHDSEKMNLNIINRFNNLDKKLNGIGKRL